MFDASNPSVALFGVLWLIWFVLGILVAIAFFKGMRALAQIPERLERIEAALLRQHAALPDDTRR